MSETASILDNPDIPSREEVEIFRNTIELHKWKVKTLRDALDSTVIEPPWVVEGLVLGECGTLISAHPKQMKSLSWLQACMEAPALHTVWGHFKAPNVGRALFIETEDPQWLVEARIRGFAKGLGLSPDDVPGFHYVCPGPFDLLRDGKNVIPAVYEVYKPDFMVLSTLQNLIPGRGMGEQKDMGPVMSEVLGFARKLCPTVLITHSPQDPKQRRAAGTVTVAANFVIEGHYAGRGDDGKLIHVQIHSKAGAGKSNFTLELETEGADDDPSAVRRIVYTGKGDKKQSRSEEAAIVLAAYPDIKVEELMTKTGLGKSAAYEAIKRFRLGRKGTGK
jgi:hypothetical protein